MIEYKTGNIFSEDVEAVVNTVNCVGVMGKGIALQFKTRYPLNYEVYVIACYQREVRPGRMLVYETRSPANPHYIINFPTKRHWRNNSRIEDITSGLHALAKEICKRSIRSIAIPALGCNNGGLAWPEVRREITTILGPFHDVRILLFEPPK
ncbi:MAG: macro domain-containing protein [Anaerolineales bacterium]|nr:macro domain-containing protein [Anaerolineales bacterium]